MIKLFSGGGGSGLNRLPQLCARLLGASAASPSSSTNPNPQFIINVRSVHHHLEAHDRKQFHGTHRRKNHHRLEKYRRLRGRKTFAVALPNPDIRRDAAEIGMMTPELRREMLASGFSAKDLQPNRTWNEGMNKQKLFNSLSSTTVMEQYEPNVKDESAFQFVGRKTKEGFSKVTGLTRGLEKRLRKERDIEFEEDLFLEEAEQKFIEANKALQRRDERALFRLVTEHAYGRMIKTIERGSIRWNWLEKLQPSSVVKVFNNTEVPHVQTLAFYDQFGRLMLGSEHVPQEVTDYIVFERNIANEYSDWRVHATLYFPESEDQKRRQQPYTTRVIESKAAVQKRKADRRNSFFKTLNEKNASGISDMVDGLTEVEDDTQQTLNK